MAKFWAVVEKIVYKILSVILGLFKKDCSDSFLESIMQFIKFGVVGVSNTLISYVIYAGSLFFFQKFGLFKKFDYIISQVLQFLLSVLWSFYWNNKMVFELKNGENRSLWKSLLKTYVSYSFTGLFLNSVLLFLWVDVFHISEYIAPFINLFINVPINFLINKFWAFKKEKQES